MSKHNEEFWLNDPVVLINYWYQFVPVPDMTTNQILNAITRFCLILIIIFLIFCNNLQFVLVMLIIILALIVFYFVDKKHASNKNIHQNKETLNNSESENESTEYKNLNVDSFFSSDNKKSNPSMQKLGRSKSSLIKKNNKKDYAKWLYPLPPTCKENSENCLRYEDLRYHRMGAESKKIQKLLSENKIE